MALLTEDRVRTAARGTIDKSKKSYGTVLDEIRRDSQTEHFDIFLSHSIKDAEIVLGVCAVLKQFSYSVYVDWITDKSLDRANVTHETASHLQKRMKQCESLLYLSTDNSVSSKWMPWELGFFDGFSDGKVAIIPVTKRSSDQYSGQEYLGVYPYVDVMGNTKGEEKLWVNRSTNIYGSFANWLKRGPSVITEHT